jgi:hypothetical protein
VSLAALDAKIATGTIILQKQVWGRGALKTIGLFRVKNHDFTPKNHIFSIF